jgi:hypothetical protein
MGLLAYGIDLNQYCPKRALCFGGRKKFQTVGAYRQDGEVKGVPKPLHLVGPLTAPLGDGQRSIPLPAGGEFF